MQCFLPLVSCIGGANQKLRRKVMPFLPTVDGRALVLSATAMRVHRFSRRKTVHCLALLAAVLPVATAAATTYVWDGNAPFGSGNSRWSRDSNWSFLNGEPPDNRVSGLTNSDIVFAGNFKLMPILDDNYYIRSLTFAPNAGAFSIVPQASQILRMGSGGIVNNSTNIQTLYNSLSLSNSQKWDAAMGNLSLRGLVNIGANTLTIDGPANVGITNTIQGSGALIKQGSGSLFLAGSAANTFSGGLTIEDGIVTVAKNNALGTGPLLMSGGVLNLGNFNLGVSSISLQGGVINSGSGGLSSSSAYQLQSGTVNSRLGGPGGLLKTTTGVVTLTTANTYTGGTQITGGKLAVNNVTGSGTGTGNVSVGSGGLLAGTGSLTGMVTNGPGGSISAGNEVGTLTIGSMVWSGGATNRWDLQDAAGVAGVGWDLLNINGTLTITATTGDQAIIDMVTFGLGGNPGTAVNFDLNQNYLWTIVQTTGGINFAPGESALTVFDLLTGNFANPTGGGKFGIDLSADGKQLNVIYTIPEPDKATLLGLGLLGLLYVRRLRQNLVSQRR